MNPTPGDVFFSPPLTAISTMYMQNANNFIADKVFPVVQVDAQSSIYYTYDRDDWFRVETRERGPATESVGSGFDVTTAPVYFARVYAVHKDVDDQTRRAAIALFDLERAATEWVSQQLLMFRERVWADRFFRSGVWTTDITGVAAGAGTGTAGAPGTGQFLQWDDANSSPMSDIANEMYRIAELTGYMPNTLVLSPRVFNALKNHPEIIERIKYTQAGVVTEDMLTAMFEVDRVVIPRAIINNSMEGATANYQFLYGKHALLTYTSGSPNLLQPSGGYMFSWRGYLGSGDNGNRIKQFRIEEKASDRIEGELAFDCRIIAPDLGVFWANVIS